MPSKIEPNIKEEINNENDKDIYFKIKYDFLSHKYFLKDLGDGYGTYIKIDVITIKEKSIFSMGNSYLAFSYDIYLNNQNKKNSKKILFLKIINKDKQYDPIILGKDKNKYTIGRSKNSDILIEDILLSKINCYLYYENNIWKIKDENQDGKPSTNGVWLYASEDNEIFNDMIFKSNNYNFHCKFSLNL